MKFKKVFYGAYEISKRGIIRRVKPGMGARVGYRLNPYITGPHCDLLYVDLHYGERRCQIAVDKLVKRAWGNG